MKKISSKNKSIHQKDVIKRFKPSKSAKSINHKNEITDFQIKSSVRKLETKIYNNKIDSLNKPHLEYIDKKLVSMKDKIILMKGVFDYVYPKIVLKKAEEITNKFKNLRERKKLLKAGIIPIAPKEKFEVTFPLQIQNFKTKNSFIITKENFSKTFNKTPLKPFYSERKAQSKISRADKRSTVVTPMKIESFNL